MNYQDFFKDRKNCVVFPCVPGPGLVRDKQIDFTVEELYQAFKARLMDEMATPFQNGKLMDMTDYAYLDKRGWVEKNE